MNGHFPLGLTGRDYDVNDMPDWFAIGWGDFAHVEDRHLVESTRAKLRATPGDLALYDLGVLTAGGTIPDRGGNPVPTRTEDVEHAGSAACGDDHNLALWLTPQAIREAFADDEDNDPTVGMTDDQLTEVGYEVLDGIYDEYRRLLDQALEAT